MFYRWVVSAGRRDRALLAAAATIVSSTSSLRHPNGGAGACALVGPWLGIVVLLSAAMMVLVADLSVEPINRVYIGPPGVLSGTKSIILTIDDVKGMPIGRNPRDPRHVAARYGVAYIRQQARREIAIHCSRQRRHADAVAASTGLAKVEVAVSAGSQFLSLRGHAAKGAGCSVYMSFAHRFLTEYFVMRWASRQLQTVDSHTPVSRCTANLYNSTVVRRTRQPAPYCGDQ